MSPLHSPSYKTSVARHRSAHLMDSCGRSISNNSPVGHTPPRTLESLNCRHMSSSMLSSHTHYHVLPETQSQDVSFEHIWCMAQICLLGATRNAQHNSLVLRWRAHELSQILAVICVQGWPSWVRWHYKCEGMLRWIVAGSLSIKIPRRGSETSYVLLRMWSVQQFFHETYRRLKLDCRLSLWLSLIS